jgi:hypothetical protein
MLNRETWREVARVCVDQIHALVEQAGLAFPVTLTICELKDPERIVMQFILPADGGKVESGQLNPIANELKATWPLLIQIEGAAGNSLEYSLEPRKRV